jgi:hypothetical protein
MSRVFIVSLSLLCGVTAFAETADVQILWLRTTKTSVATGERFTASMRWRNAGPDIARDVVATMGRNSGAFLLTGAGTSGWVCEPMFGGDGFACRGGLPPGGEAEMVVTMLAPSEVIPFVVNGRVATTSLDTQPSNDTATAPVELTPATNVADLFLGPESQVLESTAGAPFTIPILIRNNGPATAHRLTAALSFEPGELIPIDATGAGWQCEHATHSPQLAVCTLDSLASGAIAPITVRGNAPSADGVFRLYARVAAEGTRDASFLNLSTAEVRIGAAPAEWSRILVPLIPVQTAGSGGSLWTAHTTALMRAALDVKPNTCDVDSANCSTRPDLPVNRAFDAGAFDILGLDDRDFGGQFLFVPKTDAAQFHLNSRVWDSNRETQTAGSEIPIAREEDFTSSTIELLGIPVATDYRNTLRVYDLDGRNGARVAIRVFANDETVPRASSVRTLSISAFARSTTDRHLSTHPAYLQIDPAVLLPLVGITTMRIEVEPLDEGLRIWSFLSLTNNATHHVTTFTGH